MAYVYVYYDPRKNPLEPIYVGKGNDNRFKEHLSCSSNNILSSKINKIRELGLEPIIEKYIDNISDEDAYKIEIELIKTFGKIIDNNGTLCNYSDGGKGGRLGLKHSDETKKLFSEQRKGKKQTPKQYEANCNRITSEETKEKIKKTSLGRKRSTESIEKGRLKNIGQKRSDETKKLFSEQRKGKKQTPKQYEANCNRIVKTKKILCINNNITYNSAKDASIDLNLKKSSITSVANGNRKHNKNFKFIYVE